MSANEYRTSWRSRIGCVVAGIAAFVVPVGAYALWVMVPPLPTKGFDASRWKLVERSDDLTRQDMVGSLFWRGVLDGRTEREVLQILGPDCECGYFKEWDLVYWLGPERSWMSLDSEWLVIRFDEAGRVSEYTLVTD